MPSPTRRKIKGIAYTYQDLLRKHKGCPVKCFRKDPTKSPFWKSFVKIYLLARHFGAEPEDWLEAQFDRFPNRISTPLPTMMCSRAAINHFISENPERLLFTREDSKKLYQLYDEILERLEQGDGLA